MRRLPGPIRLGDCTCRADKAFTPHPPVARADAGCDACRVLSDLGDCTCGRIRRSRRIRQWRGADAGYELVASYPAYGNIHVGRIRRLPASASRCKLLLTEKIVIQHIKCAALQEKFGAPCCAPVSGFNSPELGHRRLILWHAGRTYRQLQGIITITVTLHPFQTKPN